MLSHKHGKFVCSKCGYTTGEGKLAVKEKMAEKKEIAILNKDKGENLPITDMKCPKCGNKQAYFWQLQTRSADESETSFYKCTKCSHTWRQYR